MVSVITSAKNEINERGYFWWSDETIPEGAIVPSGGISGLLTITDNGHTTLNLDGLLPSSAFFLLNPGHPTNRNISGVLLSDRRNVLLCNPISNGGTLSNLSKQIFIAEYCLINPKTIIEITDKNLFFGMDIDISSFQEWIRSGSITIKKTKRTTKISYI